MGGIVKSVKKAVGGLFGSNGSGAQAAAAQAQAEANRLQELALKEQAETRARLEAQTKAQQDMQNEAAKLAQQNADAAIAPEAAVVAGGLADESSDAIRKRRQSGSKGLADTLGINV